MKILKFLFLGLILVFVSCGTTQVVSTQSVNSESAAPEDLSVLKTSDLSINIDAVDGKELPVNTHSVKVAAGEHEITLSYHNVGGTNAITSLMNLNATLLNIASDTVLMHFPVKLNILLFRNLQASLITC